MTLADAGSPGALGLLIVVAFIVVAIVIFVAMTRSMKRMRSNVDRGDFGQPPAPGTHPDEHRTPPPSG